jgi:hypothetical protein
MPEPESELHEAQDNLIEVSEDPNQNSEEPKTSLAQEGKPRSITQYFYLLCNLLLFLSTCAFKFVGVA